MPPSVSETMVRVVTTRSQGDMRDPSARERALASAGLGGRTLYLLRQEHGTRIHRAAAAADGAAGDGWVSDRTGVALGVYVADCMPIFVWERDGAAFGVFHSGWRGTAAGMPRAAVAAFAREYGVPAGRLRVEIGPHIGACCYRVGPEVRNRFGHENVKGENVDLAGEARVQFEEAGVAAADIAVDDACTACGEVYFSYRRDKQDCRNLAFASRG